MYQKGITSFIRSALLTAACSEVFIDQYGIQPVKILRGGIGLFAGAAAAVVKALATSVTTIVKATLFFRRFIFDAVINFFARWADGVLFWITRWNPFFAA